MPAACLPACLYYPPTYLPTYLYLPTYTYLPTYLHIPTCIPTYIIQCPELLALVSGVTHGLTTQVLVTQLEPLRLSATYYSRIVFGIIIIIELLFRSCPLWVLAWDLEWHDLTKQQINVQIVNNAKFCWSFHRHFVHRVQGRIYRNSSGRGGEA